MFDGRFNESERDARMSEDPRALAVVLLAKIRADVLSVRAVVRAALFGSDAARSLRLPINGDDDLTLEEMNDVLRLVFGRIELPPNTREFLNTIVQHDLEARATLTHYELVQEGDLPAPGPGIAIKALVDDLRSNQNHREAIHQMRRPVYQLVPVYDHEGAGFRRMVNAIDDHRRDEQSETHVDDQLRNRWGMNSQVPVKIVGWQVAVVEGVGGVFQEEIFQEMNPHIHQILRDQLRLWQQACDQHDLELSDSRSYALLQMREIMTASVGTDLQRMGLDANAFTVLRVPSRETLSLVPTGAWCDDNVYFCGLNPGVRDDAIFRPSLVVDIPSES